MRKKIEEILHADKSILDQSISVYGWVRTVRDQKNFAFIELNDGSCLANLQVILNADKEDFKKLEKITTGTSICFTGKIVESPGKNQTYEMQAEKVKIYNTCDASYPLQKKRHSFEYLRTIAHLRPRTNTQGAISRVRSTLVYYSHKFFYDRGFQMVPTPIITASDCEGAGEMFRVTTIKDSKDFSKDFFKKPAYLTVSGQLNVETYACALGDVYTFGPTFRAENSNTSRHLAEFWMLEPELAFAELEDVMELAEDYIKYMVQKTLDNNTEDLEFFSKFIEHGLLERLQNVAKTPFEKISYSEAIEILSKAKKSFEFPIKWGSDLQTEHERYLAEDHFKKPVIVIDYPESIKAFYMKNNNDNKTVRAMDILVPKIGEIVGGSQREEDYNKLVQKIEKMGLNKEDYWWYLDLRKYGSIPHGGFGVGFERFIQFITGMENIRDVIPFPRVPGHADF